MDIAFADKSHAPTDAELAQVLRRTKRHWDLVLAHALAQDGVAPEWKFHGAKYGWTLKLVRKRKAVLCLSAKDRGFMASMALRESALPALRSTRVPSELIAEIESAKTYPEGRPARVLVADLKHVASVKALVEIKLAT